MDNPTKRRILATAIVIGIGILAAVGPLPTTATPPAATPNPPAAMPSNDDWLKPATVEQIAQLNENRVKLDFEWRRGGFDTVMIATFRINNGNPFAIKDIAVVCELSAPSGTTVGLNTVTLYERIPARGRKTIREVNMGRPLSLDFRQAAGASCLISKFHRA